MRNFLNDLKRKVVSVSGASLAEFATTTALMATLAATASPKLSEMSEGSKRQKTVDNIDKIIQQGQQFYQDTADSEGRGRFPGQGKYDMVVGGQSHGTREEYPHSSNYPILSEMEHYSISVALYGEWDWSADDWTGGEFNHFESQRASEWLSVFGLYYHLDPNSCPDDTDCGSTNDFSDEENLDNKRPTGHYLHFDDMPDNVNDNCKNCQNNNSYNVSGHVEWLNLFGNDVINSPFQDGHYIYRVVPGYGTGEDATSPVLFVADLENPADFHASIQP